jgi:hypothetical protein
MVCENCAGMNYKMHFDTLDAAYFICGAHDEGARMGDGSQ